MKYVYFCLVGIIITGKTANATSPKITARLELQKMIQIIHLELLKAQAGDTEKIAQALALIEAAKRKVEDVARYDDIPTNQQSLPETQPIRIALSQGPHEYHELDKSQKIILLTAGVVVGTAILVPLIVMEWKFMLEFFGMDLRK